MSAVVTWHDLECGAYTEDLGLWERLAVAGEGPVLDVGAGTGRVSLHLAGLGADVTALDFDDDLLAALRERAADAGLQVATVAADARDFDLQRSFATILVPMQTVQLLGGPEGRAAFLACARAHLMAGGVLAIALADAMEGFDAEHTEPPLPDVREIDGVVWCSRPVAVREHEATVSIERIREIVQLDGTREVTGDVIHLDRIDGPTLEAEAVAAGLRPGAPLAIAQTDEYVGSLVVMLHG